jgi:hypothetical protein
MIRQFISPHSKTAIEREIENAEAIISAVGTGYPDGTFEDGVNEALRWVLGYCPPPTSDIIEQIDRQQA